MKPNLRRDALIVLGAAAGMSALFIAKALCSLPEWDAVFYLIERQLRTFIPVCAAALALRTALLPLHLHLLRKGR